MLLLLCLSSEMSLPISQQQIFYLLKIPSIILYLDTLPRFLHCINKHWFIVYSIFVKTSIHVQLFVPNNSIITSLIGVGFVDVNTHPLIGAH